MKNKIVIQSLILALVLVRLVSAQTTDYNCPMGGYGGMMGGYYGGSTALLGWVISLLIIALIVAAIYWLIKSANKKK